MGIVIVNFNGESNNDKNIEMMWSCMKMVRTFHDSPLIWKVTNPFIESIAKFWNIQEFDKVLELKFLDTSIDVTSRDPVLICEQAVYPIELLNY